MNHLTSTSHAPPLAFLHAYCIANRSDIGSVDCLRIQSGSMSPVTRGDFQSREDKHRTHLKLPTCTFLVVSRLALQGRRLDVSKQCVQIQIVLSSMTCGDSSAWEANGHLQGLQTGS